MFRGIQGGFEAAVVAAALAFTAPSIAPCKVWYVDSSAVAANDGSSWADAFVDLHHALGKAQAGDEVWIAGGVYRPDRGTGDRSMSFVVPDGVVLYGGFAGWEGSPGERQLGEHETNLSGDLAGNDGPHNCAEVSNCCVQHEGFGCDTPSCEARVCQSAPECCTGRDDPFILEWHLGCVSTARWQCCELDGWNSCENSRIVAMISAGTMGVTFDGLTVSGAFAEGWDRGRGIRATGPRLTLRSCIFTDNQGHAVDSKTGILDVSKCEFRDNTALAIFVDHGMGTVRDTCFVRNEVGVSAIGDLEIERCLFEDSVVRAVVSSGDLAVINSEFVRNGQAVYSSGDTAATYLGCKFIDNRSFVLEFRGGMFRDCIFHGNVGGVSCALGSASLVNCVLSGTEAMVFLGGSFRLTNCTVANNAGPAFFASSDDSVRIDNSIFFNNGRPSLDNIYADDVIVNHSIVDGWEGKFPGVGTFDADPLFLDPLGPDGARGTEDDDYRLSADSPAINAGAMTASVPANDLDGHPRVLCGAVDIGAYEFGTGDPDCDGLIGPSDFQDFVACLLGPDFDYADPDFDRADPACLPFDADTNSAIDLSDFSFLQRAFNSQ